jgi:hypothetical protein
LAKGLSVEKSVVKPIGPGTRPSQKERDVTFRLLLLAAQQKLQDAGLLKHQLANDKHCFSFPKDLIKDDEIHFKTAAGRSGYRTMVGYKTRTRATGSWKRIWHFAIQPIPSLAPQPMFMIRTHVLFNEEGKPLWTNSTRLLKARRNQCKNWWNDTWRDRLLAALHWLAANDGAIHLEVGADAPILIDAEPIGFDCPVSYIAPKRASASGADFEDEQASDEFLKDSIDDVSPDDEDDVEDDDDGGISL